MSEHARKQKLPHVPVMTLERMHDGERMFFHGRLSREIVAYLEKVDGLSSAGRERWLVSLARKPQNASAPRTPGQAP